MRVVCKYCFSLILFYSQINIVAFPPHTLDLCFPDLCDHIPVYFSNLSPNQFFSLLTKLHSHRLFESPDMPVHFSALKPFFTLGIHLSSPNTHTHACAHNLKGKFLILSLSAWMLLYSLVRPYLTNLPTFHHSGLKKIGLSGFTMGIFLCRNL